MPIYIDIDRLFIYFDTDRLHPTVKFTDLKIGNSPVRLFIKVMCILKKINCLPKISIKIDYN